jgi:hypothetical protein
MYFVPWLPVVVWLLMVTTKELGTYQPVDVLSMGDGVLGALVVTGQKRGNPWCTPHRGVLGTPGILPLSALRYRLPYAITAYSI